MEIQLFHLFGFSMDTPDSGEGWEQHCAKQVRSFGLDQFRIGRQLSASSSCTLMTTRWADPSIKCQNA
eukprot:2301742-Amphidinium_carterae.4